MLNVHILISYMSAFKETEIHSKTLQTLYENLDYFKDFN